ncbi:ribosomal-processing cysteine protease Prp [Natronincola ferrireducens]|uniref:Ribosomal processing cysteine protease Prp n=1 Tax=Natronincola ferrireducens TaxID=393762 RepID=A0A1G9D1V0_9FIRM|nr:ribosomal-processing cysteine protease Prp [Natronincola ferrireducens]SDK57664.1 hypothetical protein SAMN05660472_01617 [Natronincola ferrireducens]
MIKVSVKRNKNNDVVEFDISGHAYADEPGKDIVCAAVSMLSQTILLGIYEVLEINVTYDMKNGYLYCCIPDGLSKEKRHEINILLETMIIGFKNIEKSYYQYIEVHDKEV